MHIAFLGLGLMGAPMVENLLDAGYSLTLWNRTRSKAEAFIGRAHIADEPAQAVEKADVVILMLENGPVVDDILMRQGVADAVAAGALLIDMGSVPPSLPRKHAAYLKTRGVAHLDAPVSGGTVGAAQATLSIMVGGERRQYDKAQPVFRALGKATYIGPHGAGQLAKLANQAIVGITIGAVAEALMLAAKGGADPVAVREALLGGFASSRILDLHGRRMLERDFQPGATARVQHKDLTMILDEARAEGLTLPLTGQVFEEYQALLEAGYENVDHSGLLLHLEALNQVRLDGRRKDA
ncbi:3-hydroxyisobutyrate dehydrogenase and related beta-hydroxyacid dehydrogenase [Hahella chejuensis KCTC 2396]|uniref:3-hydroxyisobutyrate dehydrogenase and related beta-hydroxyacid dehydrogenase n=1 Tax=Hahella chejuensis (strain KCTC 2396) TaxID=349521 RepID=Q2SPE5_HAHCH|nr:NAD(P)-dependent oxidoreductase [Hahella chejuensis]ABC27479.1 3-hydroxyisobutyrate dehydrogenase and related beta-hydroxyacid dehydrogenase [Hahella chejuensis KCTC 2396]